MSIDDGMTLGYRFARSRSASIVSPCVPAFVLPVAMNLH